MRRTCGRAASSCSWVESKLAAAAAVLAAGAAGVAAIFLRVSFIDFLSVYICHTWLPCFSLTHTPWEAVRSGMELPGRWADAALHGWLTKRSPLLLLVFVLFPRSAPLASTSQQT